MIRLAIFLLLLAPAMASGHAGSKSQLALEVNGAELHGRLTASLVDVAMALHLDIRASPTELRAQIDARQEQLLAYAGQGLAVLINGERQALEFTSAPGVAPDGDPVLVLRFDAQAPMRIDSVDLGYTLFFEDDVLHECLARISWDGSRSVEAVFRLGEPFQQLRRDTGSAPGFMQFLRSGIWHIWTGYDHVLFLLALLLPAVLQRAHKGWAAAPKLSAALLQVTAIVTAFTLAHSLTLACASLGWIRLPERLVESTIAASVFIAALCNLSPVPTRINGSWLAFTFGLLHGFGFAGVLAGLVPDTRDVWRPLIAFNLGVELGQLAIVAAFFPLAWSLRATRFYRIAIVNGGSVVVCICAAVWFCARI